MGTCKDMMVTDKRILVQCQKLLSHGTYLRTDVSGSKNYSTRSSSSDPSSTSQLSLSSRGALTFHCGYNENDVCERQLLDSVFSDRLSILTSFNETVSTKQVIQHLTGREDDDRK